MSPDARVVADGKHLALGGAPFKVRGVTYGGFRRRDDGAEFPEVDRARRDFRAMAGAGLNVVRTYTLPPPDVLDAAEEAGLRVLVGLHYEDWRVHGPGRRSARRVLDAGKAAVAEAIERCVARRGVLAIAVGNEVASDLVRLHGIRSVEETLSSLVEDVQDAGLLATYCNYPTTEYLDVQGQDFVSFNVFLESGSTFRAYVRHLQVVSGDAPLVVTELGLPASRHGEQAQAQLLETQLRATEELGCAGATVFSWTDDWVVGGSPVDGWGFGLTDATREPKLALGVVGRWAGSSVRDLRAQWPRVSAIVCAYNEERHILECLRSLDRCDYPNLEVILCNDGSTDKTSRIAHRFPFRVLDLPHRGLSAARNAGLAAATGDIVAYLDADATCHREWPYRLALAFEDESIGGVGGPNLPEPSAGFVERAVAAAPGGPIHVLVSDDRAEHVPGCNMAFRKEALEAIDGFDEIFTAAGDDVDACWRLLDAGHQLGFAPAAQVTHRRRDTVRAYLRQQRSYGKAERVVSGRHPHRCNRLGQARWAGSIYGGPRVLPGLLRPVVYHGRLGSAPFQNVIRRRSENALAWANALLPLAVPVLLLGALAPLSRWWLVSPAIAAVYLAAYASAVGRAVRPGRSERHPVAFRTFVGVLHVLQPLARTWGRLRGRPAATAREAARRPVDRVGWLDRLRRDLAGQGCAVKVGGAHDRWDLKIQVGPLLAGRLTAAVGWEAVPQWRVRYRGRIALVISLVAAAALSAAGSHGGAVATALLAAGVVFESRVMRGRIGRALTAAPRAKPTREKSSKRPRPVRRPNKTPKPPLRHDLAGRLGRRILAEGRPYRGRLVALFALGLLETPVLLLSPLPLKIAIDSVLSARPVPRALAALLPNAATRTGFRILIFAGALQIAVVALINLQQVAEDLLGAHIGEGLTLRFRSKVFAQLQRLSLSFHDTRGTADSMYRIQYDATAIQDYLVKGVLPLLAAVVSLVSMIYVTARIDSQLALVGLGVSPFLFLLARSYKRSLRARHRNTKELESSSLKVVQEVLTGLRVVKAFGREEAEQDRFVDRAADGMRARVGLVAAQSALGMLIGVVTAIGTATVLVIGVRDVQAGVLTIGELLIVLTYLSQLYSPLRTISRNVVQLQSAVAGAERAFELLDRYPDVADPADAQPIDRAHGTIEFRNVGFSYRDGESVLHDASLIVPAGTRLGVVGATGAGKTTLASLLMRFYEPDEGMILLDGVDIRRYAIADLRRQFGIVLQEPLLFSATVRENIAYGKPWATTEEIVRASKQANAHEFIERLPDGYETLVGERGMLLSGGERQRIALARAFLLDAPILVLDEPTSAVDMASEALIVEAMDRLMEGRTAILISHRASALRHCTACVRVEHGTVTPVTEDGDTPPEEPRPLLEPPRVAFVRAPFVDPNHEAVRAWRLVHPDGPHPTFVEELGMGPRRRRSQIVRLGGVVEGGAAIAKRERPAVVRLERQVYEEVLPSLRVASLRCYGALERQDASWIFLEDAGGEEFSEANPVHRGAAARFMGLMHIASSSRHDLEISLPSQGPARYRQHLRRGRATIMENLRNPEIRRDDLTALRATVRHLDELESGWEQIVAACARFPGCLVHGDFVAKNARVRWGHRGPTLLLMDWQTAGWGPPGPDVMRLDPELYVAVVADRWPQVRREDVGELARIGTIFRAIAAIDWDSRSLGFPWVDGALRNIRDYEGWLTLARDGASYQIGSLSL